MPTYDFHCETCKKTFEAWYSMSQKPDAIVCTECNEIANPVIIGGQGFLLKGHGRAFDRYAGKSNFKFSGDTDE